MVVSGHERSVGLEGAGHFGEVADEAGLGREGDVLPAGAVGSLGLAEMNTHGGRVSLWMDDETAVFAEDFEGTVVAGAGHTVRDSEDGEGAVELEDGYGVAGELVR